MKILVNNLTIEAKENLEQSGFEIIDTTVAKEQLLHFVEDECIDVVVFNKVDDFNAEFIDQCTNLKLIAFKEEIQYNSDIEYAKDQGIHVVTISEASANANAELVFAHLLGMSRFLHQSNREMPLEGDSNFNALKKSFTGIEIKNKTLGIIGMNNTGIAIAKKAIALGMNLKMTDHEPKNVLIPLEFFDGQSVEFYIEATDFKEVLSSSDFIVINTDSSSGYIIDTAELEQMKQSVGIVNTQQGAINEVALLEAIDHKKVAFAGLDAFENQPQPEIQLLMNPELSLSPNIGNKTYEAQLKTSLELAQKITETLA